MSWADGLGLGLSWQQANQIEREMRRQGIPQEQWKNYKVTNPNSTDDGAMGKVVLNTQKLMEEAYNPQTGNLSQMFQPSAPAAAPGRQAGEYYTPEGSTYGRVAGGTGYAGMQRPDYIMMRDPVTGQLHQNFQMGLGDSYSQMKKTANTVGDTPWATLMRQQIAANKAGEMGSAATQGQSAVTSAMNRLAMQGGLTRGASERLASGGMGNLMRARQDVGRNSNMNNLNVSLQDYMNKQQLLGQVAPAEQKVQAGNIGNLMRDIGSENEMNRLNYGEDMSAWAAEKTGKAQERAAAAGKSGGLLSGILDVGSWF